MPLDPATELALIELELESRAISKRARPDFLADLFPQQRSIVTNGAFVSVWLAGRRYGKSVGASRWLLDGCFEKPGTAQLYTSKTRLHAKQVIWGELKRALAIRGFERVAREPRGPMEYSRNDTELALSFANGSTVHLLGLNSVGEADKIRGIMKLYRKFIDECGATKPSVLEYAADECLEPASIDMEGPTIYAGTPGKSWHGYWFQLSGPGRTVKDPLFRGTMFDNPHLPHAARLAAEIKKRHGWADDHPTWVSEYLGQWAHDADSLPFPWDPVDSAPALPEYRSAWRYVLAIDVGQVNASGYTLWAAHDNDPADWIVSSWRRENQLIDSMAADIRKTWGEVGRCRVVMDTGGMGKQHAEELRRRKGIPVEAAEKRDKASALRVLRDQILSHRVKVLDGKRNDAIRDDFAVARWNDERTDIEENRKDPTSHLDAAHAALYGHRALRNYLYADEEPELSPDEVIRAKLIKQRAAHLKREKGRPIYDR